MRALEVPRTRQQELGRSARPDDSRRHRCHRSSRHGHHLRHRPAHPRRDVPAVTDGRILGHEAVGTVTEVGAGRRTFGPATSSSRVSPRGRCRYCRESRYGQCPGGGWILGHRINGTCRVRPGPVRGQLDLSGPGGRHRRSPDARRHPPSTGYEVGVLNVVGSAYDTVRHRRSRTDRPRRDPRRENAPPSHIVAIDLAAGRLDAAKQFGADIVINNSEADPAPAVMEPTDGLGADATIEAVGIPDTFDAQGTRSAPALAGQRRRPRQARHPPSRRPLDQERDHHDRTGRHVLDPDSASPSLRQRQ